MSTPFNMLQGFSYAHEMGEAGRQRGEKTYLNRLAGEAYGAAPEQRQSALARLVGADAQTGTAMASHLEQGDEAKRKRQAEVLARHARVAAQLPPEQLATAWPALRARVMADDPELGAMLSEQYDEATVRPILAQFAGESGGVSVRSSFVGADGDMYSIMSDGSVKSQGIGADRKLQAFDVPGVGPQVVDLRNATARTVTSGGGAPAPQQASTFAFTPAAGAESDPDAAAFQNLPPDQQEVAAKLLQQGQDFTIQGGRVVPSGMRGGQPMNQPVANRPPTLDRIPLSQIGGGDDRPAWVRPPAGAGADGKTELDRKIETARRLGATDEDIKRMVLGRDAAAGGSKPMPASVLKMREMTVAEAETANTINLSIDKHLGRIESNKLQFGPVQNLLSQGRNFVNESTEESRNFAEFKADLEKLRNDSLRLNAGVQTDGDAKRAWDELIANINDGEYVKQRLETIRGLNERAAILKQASVERIDAEYGKAEQPAQASPSSSGWGIQKL